MPNLVLSPFSRCLYRQSPPSLSEAAHEDLSSLARIAIVYAIRKLLDHLNDSVARGRTGARRVDGSRSVALRGRAHELLYILEEAVPLQYDGVILHTNEVQEILTCRPLLTANISVLMSDYSF